MALASSRGTLNELEGKINTLERSNFDLKLRLHYLHSKYGHLESKSPTKGANFGYDIREEIQVLTEDNEYAKQRIVELESEILQLQLQREKDAEEYQAALRMKPAAAQHLEEQRKREREVSLAIAEHDATVIAKLHEDLKAFETQKSSSDNLISSLNEKVAYLSRVLEGKDAEIDSLLMKMREMREAMEQMSRDSHVAAQSMTLTSQPIMVTTNTNGAQTSIMLNAAGAQVNTTNNGANNSNTSLVLQTNPADHHILNSSLNRTLPNQMIANTPHARLSSSVGAAPSNPFNNSIDFATNQNVSLPAVTPSQVGQQQHQPQQITQVPIRQPAPQSHYVSRYAQPSPAPPFNHHDRSVPFNMPNPPAPTPAPTRTDHSSLRQNSPQQSIYTVPPENHLNAADLHQQQQLQSQQNRVLNETMASTIAPTSPSAFLNQSSILPHQYHQPQVNTQPQQPVDHVVQQLNFDHAQDTAPKQNQSQSQHHLPHHQPHSQPLTTTDLATNLHASSQYRSATAHVVPTPQQYRVSSSTLPIVGESRLLETLQQSLVAQEQVIASLQQTALVHSAVEAEEVRRLAEEVQRTQLATQRWQQSAEVLAHDLDEVVHELHQTNAQLHHQQQRQQLPSQPLLPHALSSSQPNQHSTQPQPLQPSTQQVLYEVPTSSTSRFSGSATVDRSISPLRMSLLRSSHLNTSTSSNNNINTTVLQTPANNNNTSSLSSYHHSHPISYLHQPAPLTSMMTPAASQRLQTTELLQQPLQQQPATTDTAVSSRYPTQVHHHQTNERTHSNSSAPAGATSALPMSPLFLSASSQQHSNPTSSRPSNNAMNGTSNSSLYQSAHPFQHSSTASASAALAAPEPLVLHSHPDISVYERTIDLYKLRENELLNALEGVVRRVHELDHPSSPPSLRRPVDSEEELRVENDRDDEDYDDDDYYYQTASTSPSGVSNVSAAVRRQSARTYPNTHSSTPNSSGQRGPGSHGRSNSSGYRQVKRVSHQEQPPPPQSRARGQASDRYAPDRDYDRDSRGSRERDYDRDYDRDRDRNYDREGRRDDRYAHQPPPPHHSRRSSSNHRGTSSSTSSSAHHQPQPQYSYGNDPHRDSERGRERGRDIQRSRALPRDTPGRERSREQLLAPPPPPSYQHRKLL